MLEVPKVVLKRSVLPAATSAARTNPIFGWLAFITNTSLGIFAR